MLNTRFNRDKMIGSPVPAGVSPLVGSALSLCIFKLPIVLVPQKLGFTPPIFTYVNIPSRKETESAVGHGLQVAYPAKSAALSSCLHALVAMRAISVTLGRSRCLFSAWLLDADDSGCYV